MSKELRRVSLAEFADNLLSIFDEVVRNEQTVVVEKDADEMAVLKPLRSARKRPRARPATDEPFFAAFGAWKHIVDGDALKETLAEARGSNRRPVSL